MACRTRCDIYTTCRPATSCLRQVDYHGGRIASERDDCHTRVSLPFRPVRVDMRCSSEVATGCGATKRGGKDAAKGRALASPMRARTATSFAVDKGPFIVSSWLVLPCIGNPPKQLPRPQRTCCCFPIFGLPLLAAGLEWGRRGRRGKKGGRHKFPGFRRTTEITRWDVLRPSPPSQEKEQKQRGMNCPRTWNLGTSLRLSAA